MAGMNAIERAYRTFVAPLELNKQRLYGCYDESDKLVETQPSPDNGPMHHRAAYNLPKQRETRAAILKSMMRPGEVQLKTYIVEKAAAMRCSQSKVREMIEKKLLPVKLRRINQRVVFVNI